MMLRLILVCFLLICVFDFNHVNAIPPVEVRVPPEVLGVSGGPQARTGPRCFYCRVMPFYVKGWAGAAFMNDNLHERIKFRYDTGIVGGLALGAATWKCCWLLLDFEAEALYQYNKIRDARFRNQSLGFQGYIEDFAGMANFIFSCPFRCGLKPYVGAGIGAGREKCQIKTIFGKFTDRERRFVYQFMGGFSLTFLNTLCATVSIFAEARYFKFDKHAYTTIADGGFIIEY